MVPPWGTPPQPYRPMPASESEGEPCCTSIAEPMPTLDYYGCRWLEHRDDWSCSSSCSWGFSPSLALRLWPHGTPAAAAALSPYATPGVTFPRATVTSLLPTCPVDLRAIQPDTTPLQPPPSGGSNAGNPAQAAPGTVREPCGKITATVLDGTGQGQQVSFDLPRCLTRVWGSATRSSCYACRTQADQTPSALADR